MAHSITVTSSRREEMIDITSDVAEIVAKHYPSGGLCCVYTPHTTAAVTINENADPSIRTDIIKGLASLGLEKIPFSHREGNSPAHIKSSLIGCSCVIFIENGRLKLGTWQGIYFCEFDGPRTRTVMVKAV